MQTFEIGKNEAGQRLDKFLHKYLKNAQNSFLFKMLRKKNITLNGKKAEGKEILQLGDNVSFFFSDETFELMSGSNALCNISEYERAYQRLKGITVLYEDEHCIIVNKPAGVLTQKSKDTDLSLNEWLIGYLLRNKKITQTNLQTFHPSVCNRLDRNTSGLVLCGVSLAGSQLLSKLIQERIVHKYYRTIVKGQMTKGERLSGYLYKDEKTNKVTVVKEQPSNNAYSAIETAYEPLKINSDKMLTYLEVELITGKTHQIRAHLASIGHSILGDSKYGRLGMIESNYGVDSQLLHAYRLEFPDLLGTALEALSNKEIIAPLPIIFDQIMNA